MHFSSQRFLMVYSGVLTAVFAITVLTGFRSSPATLDLKELDVQRINVVEPDGTLRMVISSKAAFPGLIVKGEEYPHPNRKTAGVLFFNDEGTENGGLTFGGYEGEDGKPVSYGHLSFDKYMQDQTLVLEASQGDGKYAKGLSIVDRPDYPMTEILPLTKKLPAMTPDERKAAIAEFVAGHEEPAHRLYLGESPDKAVGLDLKDTEGRSRIVLRVKPDGSPILQFLDAEGEVIRQLPETGKQ